MASIEKVIAQMRLAPGSVRFAELLRVCKEHFGPPQHTTGSHVIFKTPWPGDPRINIQNDNGKAKTYQVRQVLLALDKLAAPKGEHP